MNNLRLISVTETKTAKDNREYYGAKFQDPTNPFAKAVTRNFWQQRNSAGEPIWNGAAPDQVKPFIGKTIPGKIVTAKVEPYEVVDGTGVARTAITYTTVILGSELDEAVFKSMRHPMVKADTQPVVVAAPIADEITIA